MLCGQRYATELSRFLRFGLVGVVGFVVDTGLLYLGLAAGLGLWLGRVVSYLGAVTATWLLNRRFTFRGHIPGHTFHEWGRFAVSQLGGAITNLGIYGVLIEASVLARSHPVVGVAAGSLSGLVINYSLARIFVFRGTLAGRHDSSGSGPGSGRGS